MAAFASVERPAHIPESRVVDFDLYAPPGVRDDFHAAWKTLQAPGMPDIVWTPRNGGHWIVTRNRLIDQVMNDYQKFSSNFIVIPKEATVDNKFLPTMVDLPEHRKYRILMNSSLSPKAVSAAESTIRRIAIKLIETVRQDGRCNFTSDYAELLPIQIFLGMADLPMTDAALLRSWSDQMLRPHPGTDWGDDRNGFARGARLFFEYLSPVIDARVGGDGDDLLSRLINGQVDGRSLTKHEALQITTQTVIAGVDTVVNFLGFVMHYLATHPKERAELVADPELIPVAVEEMFRRYPIVVIGREVAADIEFEGVQLKQGDMVCTPTPLGGLDETANRCPMDVDLRRESMIHTTFGSGSHKCPGAHLARTEIRITLEEWLGRIPDFSLAPGAEITFTGGVVAVVDALPLVWDAGATTDQGLRSAAA